jgi:GNAT superfamily N-acetyltransferase
MAARASIIAACSDVGRVVGVRGVDRKQASYHAVMEDGPTGLRMVRARARSLAAINRLVARSKAYWHWPEGYLEKALALQKVTRAYLRSNHCCEVLDGSGRLVAFLSVVVSDARPVLDNLWVTPERIGHGIGRWACAQVFQWARERGWMELRVVPDPPAEGFYRKIGFADTGERLPSRIPGGPLFSVYRIPLASQPGSG